MLGLLDTQTGQLTCARIVHVAHSRPIAEVPSPAPSGDLARRFRQLAADWRRDTDVVSSPTGLFMHPAYQQIIGMGPAALPLIFADLQTTGANWFWALRSITGDNPVPAEDRGNIPRMTEHWLEWARSRGMA
jgi:hypothetical protein